MVDSILTRSYVTVLVAVSVGSVLCWGILVDSEYYVCSTVENNLMSTAIALDVIRVIMALLTVIIVQTKPDKNKRVLSTICCMISCGVLLGMFTAWSEACEDCLLRTTNAEQFDASVAAMFKQSVVSGNPCSGGPASTESYWFNPKSWCRESTKVNCYQLFALDNVAQIKSIQPCIRFGCTDYMPESQWAFLVDIIGDLCRVLVFYMYSTSLQGSKDQRPTPTSTSSKKTKSVAADDKSDSDDDENDTKSSLLSHRTSMTLEQNPQLRHRRNLDLSF